MKILITSGGTKIPIDRVRSITNMSKGTFGSRIADAFYNEGLKSFRDRNEQGNSIEKITFFMAKGSKLPTLQSVNDETYEDGYRPIEYVEYSTFDDYKNGMLTLRVGETLKRDELLERIIKMQFARNNIEFDRGTFRSKGDNVDIIPTYEKNEGIRIALKNKFESLIKETEELLGSEKELIKEMALYLVKNRTMSTQVFKNMVKKYSKTMNIEQIKKDEKNLNNYYLDAIKKG